MLYAPALINRAIAAPMQPQAIQPGFERFMRSLMPAFYDVQEDDASWTVSLDVPGITRDQLRVNVIGTTVTVDTVEDAPRRVSAAYELPHEIDVDKCEAKLENGVLTLKLAKVESAKPRQIAVS